jgi:stage II sporulation protein D
MQRKKDGLLAILLGIILPALLLHFSRTQELTVEKNTKAIVLTENGVIEMGIDEYLLGVLLYEMPANFHMEALKAQAVAARTFVLYGKQTGNKHSDADVCTSAVCCQGYIDPVRYISNGGDPATVNKMYSAIEETKGEVLLYDEKLIEATYFSSSGGRTEDALTVWGVEVPYLISVDSAETDDPYIRQMSKEMFCKALGMTGRDVYIDAPTYTQGGGIAEIEINGKLFTGVQLRKFLGLRSTQISFSVENESVEIITKGHGHRVGMSQYGADAMAECGSNYIEILTHYYSGVTIQPYVLKNN